MVRLVRVHDLVHHDALTMLRECGELHLDPPVPHIRGPSNREQVLGVLVAAKLLAEVHGQG